jgi:hypothetical protein
MPAKDIYHNTMKTALEKDGWKITHDPFKLKIGTKDLYIDLGSKSLFSAENKEQLIAVEIKSFSSPSSITDLEKALGQYILYNDILQKIEPKRILWLAIPNDAYIDLFEEEPIGKILLENKRIKLIVFDIISEDILQWIT